MLTVAYFAIRIISSIFDLIAGLYLISKWQNDGHSSYYTYQAGNKKSIYVESIKSTLFNTLFVCGILSACLLSCLYNFHSKAKELDIVMNLPQVQHATGIQVAQAVVVGQPQVRTS